VVVRGDSEHRVAWRSRFCCSYVKRLREISDGVGGWSKAPDAAGEVALEAADGLADALAFLAFAVEAGLCLGVAAGAGDGDAMHGCVDLAVPAAIEAMAVGLAGADRDRRHAGGAGELGLAAEALGAGDLADELGRG
jgi:hypothetical protein